MQLGDESVEGARKLRVAVLISGGGTNLQAFIDGAAAGRLHAEIAVVVSDRQEAYGLERARQAGIPTHVVDYREYLKRDLGDPLQLVLPVSLKELAARQKILTFPDSGKILDRLARLVLAEQELVQTLDRYQPDYVCLAGFMRLLSPYFLGSYNKEGKWRVINIHPALLPAFPGQHGYDDTFAYGCKWGGITVHFADEGEDTGPIIAQAVYPVWPDDDLEAVRRRGLALEYEIYAQCINWLAEGFAEEVAAPQGRFWVRITDPNYPTIVRSWMAKALA
jgi:phosphoribosylglycinamide formyltransferase 1